MTPRQNLIVNVIAPIAKKHFVTVDAIMSNSRVHHIVAARDEAMFALYPEHIPTLTRTGRVFGRDHSTVVQALRRYKHRVGIRDDDVRKLEERREYMRRQNRGGGKPRRPMAIMIDRDAVIEKYIASHMKVDDFMRPCVNADDPRLAPKRDIMRRMCREVFHDNISQTARFLGVDHRTVGRAVEEET